MTMTMTHSDKVNQHLSETWPYGHEWWGHDPLEKNRKSDCRISAVDSRESPKTPNRQRIRCGVKPGYRQDKYI